MSGERQDEVSRRDFLLRTTSGAAALGVGAMVPAGWAAPAQSRPAVSKPVLPHGKLGRTGYPATLVSFGGILLKGTVGTRVLQLAIDSGVNLVHTSDTYGRGASLAACGDLFKPAPAYRDKIFLCLKSCTPEKESEIDDMLRALGTDRADAVLTELHSPDPKRIEAIQKQQDALEKKGKVRHTGFVCHGDMNEVLELVLDKHAAYFDIALLAMKLVPNMGNDAKPDEAGQRFLKNVKAMRTAGIGVLSMKSGAKKAVTEGAKVFGPHIKAYLEAGADAMLTSMDTLDQVDMVSRLDLTNPHLTPDERRAAAEFHRADAAGCRMCAECKKVCPRGLPVNDLLRFRMYHDDYGWPEHARAEYAALGVDFRRAVLSCGDCTACTDVCPVNLAGPQTIRKVAETLG
jgi:predicted aldo/keto reductase-like oxidoreductase